jgi:hypothetical protein
VQVMSEEPWSVLRAEVVSDINGNTVSWS